jgi:hypothetical protein
MAALSELKYGQNSLVGDPQLSRVTHLCGHKSAFGERGETGHAGLHVVQAHTSKVKGTSKIVIAALGSQEAND